MSILVFRRTILRVRQIINHIKFIVVVKNLWQWQLPMAANVEQSIDKILNKTIK